MSLTRLRDRVDEANRRQQEFLNRNIQRRVVRENFNSNSFDVYLKDIENINPMNMLKNLFRTIFFQRDSFRNVYYPLIYIKDKRILLEEFSYYF